MPGVFGKEDGAGAGSPYSVITRKDSQSIGETKGIGEFADGSRFSTGDDQPLQSIKMGGQAHLANASAQAFEHGLVFGKITLQRKNTNLHKGLPAAGRDFVIFRHGGNLPADHGFAQSVLSHGDGFQVVIPQNPLLPDDALDAVEHGIDGTVAGGGVRLALLERCVEFAPGDVRLAEGDRVEMPGGRLLVLEDFSYTAYDDGRPRDWTSTVRVARDGRDEVPPFPIRVNHPLRLGRMSIYQVSHAVESLLAVTDSAGKDHLLAQGEEATQGGATLFFMARPQEGGEVIVRVESAGGAEVLRLSAGDSAAGFVVQGLREVDITGLEAVIDPGYPVVLAGLGLVLVGLAVTFISRIGDTGS